MLGVTFVSPSGALTGLPAYLYGLIYPSGGSPGTTPGYPTIQMNIANATLMFGSFGNIFQIPGLPPAGVSLSYYIPPGLSGNRSRMQAFVANPTAANGLFSASAAHDVVLQ